MGVFDLMLSFVAILFGIGYSKLLRERRDADAFIPCRSHRGVREVASTFAAVYRRGGGNHHGRDSWSGIRIRERRAVHERYISGWRRGVQDRRRVGREEYRRGIKLFLRRFGAANVSRGVRRGLGRG